MQKPKAASKRLLEAHERREHFVALPPELAPRDAEEAYAIQDAFVARRAERLGAIAGYKIALSTPEMQRFVGVDKPQAGVMLASTLHRTPASVRAAACRAAIIRQRRPALETYSRPDMSSTSAAPARAQASR